MQFKMRIMKKLTLIASCVALLLSSCAHEYNQVLKSGDYTYKYEYAKQSYAQGKYSRAIPLLQELVTMKKGSTEGEECLYMLAMAEYGMKDYETAQISRVSKKVLKEVSILSENVAELVIVTNNVFEDGVCYDESTMNYIKAMGIVNRGLAAMAERVVEVVAGIPVAVK